MAVDVKATDTVYVLPAVATLLFDGQAMLVAVRHPSVMLMKYEQVLL